MIKIQLPLTQSLKRTRTTRTSHKAHNLVDVTTFPHFINLEDYVPTSMRGKHILVLGATGRLGAQVVNQALDASYHVTALVRSDLNLPFTRYQLRNPNLVIMVGSVLSRKDLDKVIEGQDAVINCLGPHLLFNNNDIDICSRSQQLIIDSMINHGVRRLIVVSTQGVGDSSVNISSTQKFFGRLFSGKILDDKEMQEKIIMKYSDQLDWTIIRPGKLSNGNLTNKWRLNDKLTFTKISRANVAFHCKY